VDVKGDIYPTVLDQKSYGGSGLTDPPRPVTVELKSTHPTRLKQAGRGLRRMTVNPLSAVMGCAFYDWRHPSTHLQGVRYDERVNPSRNASMYWVRSLALSRALDTLSR